ncbi:CAP domain-containing protein [Streptomyces sp. NPDC002513]
MGKHRKDKHYRHIVMAAVAVAAVGVPTVALACVDWQGGGTHQTHTDAQNTNSVSWNRTDRPHRWQGEENGAPSPTPSRTPTAAKSTPKTAAPKPKATVRPKAAKTGAAKTTAPAHRGATATAGTPKATATRTSPSAPGTTAKASGATARVVELVNAERAKVGCSPLTLNATLTKVAQAHSDDMAAHRNMSHTGSDGSSPGDRITRAGYDWSAYGENVAYGYSTPEQVMAGWMSSSGHKANILNCAFKEIGVGLAQPGSYWTQNFGTAR